MYVICINAGDKMYITEGIIYETMDVLNSANFVTIINDRGDQVEYYASRFELYTPVCGAEANDGGGEAEVPVPNKKPVDLLEATRKFLGR